MSGFLDKMLGGGVGGAMGASMHATELAALATVGAALKQHGSVSQADVGGRLLELVTARVRREVFLEGAEKVVNDAVSSASQSAR